MSRIGETGGQLGFQCKKVCSWRALEEEGQRTCVTLAGDLLGNAPEEAMLACTQGGRVGGKSEMQWEPDPAGLRGPSKNPERRSLWREF